jgi:hypothetical protein
MLIDTHNLFFIYAIIVGVVGVLFVGVTFFFDFNHKEPRCSVRGSIESGPSRAASIIKVPLRAASAVGRSQSVMERARSTISKADLI